MDSRRVRANGVELACTIAGPDNGRPVVLLHGFPEIAYGWRRQIPVLAEAGFRVIAPDQRGYGTSDKPAGVAAYSVETLAEDVVGIAAALGHDRFALVGHDWGGIVAWHLAGRHAAHIDRLAILNAPNLDVFPGYALHHPAQLLRSAYVGAFQLPLLPEITLAAFDYALLQAMLTQSARPGTFAPPELAVYREAWAQPGALTAMLNWYRGVAQRRTHQAARIAMSTLIVWGDRDVALQSSLAEASAELCDRVEVVHVEEAGHWVQHEAAEEVNSRLVAFLRRPA
jgi:pimeloyl-ACP methyl ester carboxylesterase